MSTLFTFNKGPAQARSLSSCASLMRDDDALVLYEEGVYWAIPGGTNTALKELARRNDVFVLDADLTARGLKELGLLPGLRIIDYREFVRLAAGHAHCQSWF